MAVVVVVVVEGLVVVRRGWYGARRHRGRVCQLERNVFCIGIRERSTIRLGASTIMGVDLLTSINC